MISIVFKKDKTFKIDKPASDLSVLVRSGVKANLVLKGLVKGIKVKVEGKANFHLVNLVKAVKQFNCQAIIELVGAGASGRVSGLFHGISKDSHAFDVVLHHKAPNTKGDILIRGVYENRARGVFSGLIKINPKARGTDSFFANNNLLLDQASVISVPQLEIETDNIKASHGSTTGRVDEGQLYYLMSRGLSEKIARCMIIEGFFQPVINRLP